MAQPLEADSLVCSQWVTQERWLGRGGGAWLRSFRGPCLESEAGSGPPVDHMVPHTPNLSPQCVLLSDPWAYSFQTHVLIPGMWEQLSQSQMTWPEEVGGLVSPRTVYRMSVACQGFPVWEPCSPTPWEVGGLTAWVGELLCLVLTGGWWVWEPTLPIWSLWVPQGQSFR